MNKTELVRVNPILYQVSIFVGIFVTPLCAIAVESPMMICGLPGPCGIQCGNLKSTSGGL